MASRGFGLNVLLFGLALSQLARGRAQIMRETDENQPIQRKMSSDWNGNHNGIMTRVRGERLSMYIGTGANKNEY